jgi:hypothetical protein
MTSNMSTAICGPITYSVDDGSGNAIDYSMFYFDKSSRTFTLFTNVNSKKGTYTIRENGVQGLYPQKQSTIFNIQIDSCKDNVITPYVVTPNPSYTVGNSALTVTFLPWTSTISHCGTITYAAYDYNTNSAINSNYISFSASGLSFTTQTSNVAFAGNHTFIISGTTTSPGGVVVQVNATFSETIVDPCLTATLSANSVNTLLTYYTHETLKSEILSSASSTISDTICGAMSYSIPGLDTAVFSLDPTTRNLTVYTTNDTKAGVYSLTLKG